MGSTLSHWELLNPSSAPTLGREGQARLGSCWPRHPPSARILGLPLFVAHFLCQQPLISQQGLKPPPHWHFRGHGWAMVVWTMGPGHPSNPQGLSLELCPPTPNTGPAWVPSEPSAQGPVPLGRPGHPASPQTWHGVWEPGDTCPGLPAEVRLLRPHHGSWWCRPRAAAVPAWCLQISVFHTLCSLFCVCTSCAPCVPRVRSAPVSYAPCKLHALWERAGHGPHADWG